MADFAPIIGIVIAYLGGRSVVILGLSSWLGKVWASRILNKEIEELRSKYKIIEAEYSIKFAALHSRRAEVIAEIYSLLSEIEIQARLLANPLMEPDEPSKNETYSKVANLINEFFVTYSKYRIFLTEDTCSKIDDFIHHSRLPLSFFQLADKVKRQDPGGNNSALQNRLKDKLMEVCEEVETKVPYARRAVEVEFRKTLGVIE